MRLVLLFGAILRMTTCDETENIDDPNPASGISPEPQHNVTWSECLNAINSTIEEKCCQDYRITMDDDVRACKSFIPKVQKPKSSLKFTECLYTRKNYNKSDTELNYKQIKADIRKSYPDNAKARHLTLKMYKKCDQTAKEKLEVLKNRLGDISKPFFCFVYVCLFEYQNTYCPFILWNSYNERTNKTCSDYSAQCKYLKAASKIK